MSAATTAAPATGALPTPKFLGVLRAEIFKMSRQPVNWLMAAGVLAMVALPWVLLPTTPFIRNELQANPLIAQFVQMGRSLTILRVFGGLFVIVLTARVFGLDYQQGTIRIILARGVGRLQLLGAKLLTVTLAALAILGVGVLADWLYAVVFTSAAAGNLNSFNALTPTFWLDVRLYVLTIAISMGVTILMASAATVLGRSLSFGLAAGLVFFPADNILSTILTLLSQTTNNTFWLNLTGYLLGPTLNTMPTKWIAPITSTVTQ
ncbi:MAG TPA: ABC transporter permease subunit, partial [Ktedonobacterales bacterium]|nr:ABC transporter permease subunit [Ktedonobacterales bacterium]